MFPSSDPAIPNNILTEDGAGDDTMPRSSDAMDCEPRCSTGPYSPVEMSQAYTETPPKKSRSGDGPFDAAAESTFEVFNEYIPVPSPLRSSKAASYQQLSPAARPSYTQPRVSQDRSSQQPTPDSKGDHAYGDEYHGASDISIRRSASSTEAELFSDVNDDDCDDSGFEPTETAELPVHARGALNSIQSASASGQSRESEQREQDNPDSDTEDDVEGDSLEHEGQVHHDRFRTVSYESYPDANSPTESQLIDEGFEFHNQLPEHRQAGHFENESFREALRDISPRLPRKQQWYAWRKVMEMLENEQPGDDDLFDDSDLPNDFSLGSLAEHHFGGCHCGGDANKCSCAPGQCSCNACPRRANTEQEMSSIRDLNEDGEEEDVPMVIGYTPITPMFPDLNRSHHSRDAKEPEVTTMLPGLGLLDECKHTADPASTSDALVSGDSSSNCDCSCGQDCQCPAGQCRCDKSNESPNAADSPGTTIHHASDRDEHKLTPNCACSCGDECLCPSGRCRCEKSIGTRDDRVTAGTTVDQLFDDPFKRPAAFYRPRDSWSEAATASQSPAPSDFREPRGAEPHFPQIASQLSSCAVFSPNDAPTPAQGIRSPEPVPATPLDQPISRPDTPRPQGTSYEYGIRQSVEPEPLSPVSHRHSTPAYENRSLSPSPTSQKTPSDTSMHDATPTQPGIPAMFDRESSALPDAPPAVPDAVSPPESPSEHVPPVPAIPGQQRPDQYSQYAHIPPPPIPVSPTLKPRKQRTTSTSATSNGRRNTKSAVHGSKITKAQPKQRNVTRKATGKKVKAAVDRIEDTVRKAEEEEVLQNQRVSSRGSVRSWNAEEIMQRDGSPPRRSARVRQRAASPLVFQ